MKIRSLLSVSLSLGLWLALPALRAADEAAKEPAEQTSARAALEKAYDEAFEAADREVFDAPALRAKLDAFLARYPQDSAAASFVSNYFYYVESVDLGQAKAEWSAYANQPNEKIQALVAKKLALGKLLESPIEMKFTAADGRAVDVGALRGKVVLIDFWATWCGPCIQEIPNVVAAYNQYHEQGFEIVGISFDKAPDPAKPNPRHKTAEGVLAFAKEKGMPWPQYYDGLHWNNVFGKQYGIQGIPAMFLLDKRGMVISTNARGPKLAHEIQRLLKE